MHHFLEQVSNQYLKLSLFFVLPSVDTRLLMCLIFQVTYEGLLDDIFGINCGAVEFGPEVTGTEKSVKTMLNSDDPIFSQIRNR